MSQSGYRYISSMETRGDKKLSSHVYYNISIINNTTTDLATTGIATRDPQIRFNETRDKALIEDASKYYFSIVRFSMNGPNRNLPLFIPVIQLGQSNPNLTTYSTGLTLQQTWNVSTLANATGQISFNITPAPVFALWIPEIQNTSVAPVPGPPTTVQDLASKYYFCGTYQWWLNIVNTTLTSSYQALYTAFAAAWAVAVATDLSNNPFPYPTFLSFQAAVCNTPQITYDPVSHLFSVWMDSRAFGSPLIPFAAVPYSAGVPGAATSPRIRLFMNTNMYGLFANIPSIFWNTTSPLASLVVGDTAYDSFGAVTPAGYTYEITAVNQFFQNVVDFRQSPYGAPVPFVANPTTLQQPYYKMTQDFPSDDSLWSPIESIVFASSLLPVKTEQVAQPTVFGQGNIGLSAATSASAFTPIITDIALDTTVGGAAAYRQFISYAPAAEYRLSDFGPSKVAIQNVDVFVYWKNRLDGQLYPISMYNLSSVSLKILFRLKESQKDDQ